MQVQALDRVILLRIPGVGDKEIIFKQKQSK